MIELIMLRKTTVVILTSFTWMMTPVTKAAPPAGVYTTKTPAEIASLLASLEKQEDPLHIIRLLTLKEEAAPYLRAELSKAVPESRYYRDLTEAIAKHQARAYERNRKRYEKWLEEGRLDLCTELLVVCPEMNDAASLADLTIPIRKIISDQFDRACTLFPPNYKYDRKLFGVPNFSRNYYEHKAGQNLTLPPDTALTNQALIRADRCTTEVFCRDRWLVAVRTDLQEKLAKGKGTGEWFRSILLVNNSIQLPRVSDCLIVCDGDVEPT